MFWRHAKRRNRRLSVARARARANPKRTRGRAKKTEVLTSTGSPNQKSRIQIQGDLQWGGGRASLAVAATAAVAASSDSRIAVVTLSIVWMATVASVSPALQRLRSEVQAANAPRINGDAMVRCCRIAIGFFKVVVEIPYWRGVICRANGCWAKCLTNENPKVEL